MPRSPQVASCLRQIGDLRSRAKENAAAVDAYSESLRVTRALGSDDNAVAYLLHQIGYNEYGRKDFAAAAKSYESALELRRRLFGDDADPTLITLCSFAKNTVAQRRFAAAEPLCREFHERAVRTRTKQRDYTDRAKKLMVKLYEAWDRKDAADRWR